MTSYPKPEWLTAIDQAQRQEEPLPNRPTAAGLYGQRNPACRLSDADVERMRELHELPPPDNIGYRRLARMFGCSKAQVRRICNYQQRY